MLKRTFLLMTLLGLCLGCSSGSKIREQGFTADELQGETFSARFEGRSMSEEDAKDNLLYHSARKTLDSGNLYFSVEDLRTEKRRETERRDSVQAVPPTSTAGEPVANVGAGSEPSYTESLSFPSIVTATARVKMFRDRPADGNAYEASRIMEQLRNK